MLGRLRRGMRLLAHDGLRAAVRRTRGRLADARAASPGHRQEAALIRAAHVFDPAHYLTQHPEAAAPGRDPLLHYVTVGWRDSDPHPLFSRAFYLETNPDVAEAGVNPFVHFLSGGWREGRDPHPLFDCAHYLDHNQDVERAGVNPFVHFLAAGWSEDRSPLSWFDPAYYRAHAPDLLPGTNPLLHFVRAGMRAGHRPSPFFDTGMPVPLPPSAWQPGGSDVERIIRTFVYRRRLAATPPEIEACLLDIEAAAAAQAALADGGAEATPDVSIVVPVFNQLRFTLWCLYALAAGRYDRTFEVVVVDDASQDATAAVLARLPWVRHVRGPENRGFVRSCNLGAQQARGRDLVFLNNDTLPQQGWLDALCRTLHERPQAGVVGAKLVYPDGRLQEAGGIVWQDGTPWNYGRGGDRRRPDVSYLRGVDFCSGAALAIRADLFRAAGGFDEAFAPAYAEDADLALRLRHRGHPALYQPLAEVVHLEGITSGTSTRGGVKVHQVRNLQRLFERWQVQLRGHRPPGVDPHLEKDRGRERRALFLDAFTPRPDQDAGSLDALHWMQALGALGLQVTFLPCFDLRHAGHYTTDLQGQGIECVYEPYLDSPEEFVQRHGSDFDLCVFYRFEVADRMLPLVRRFSAARRLLALCDLAHVRLRRQAAVSGSEKELRASYEVRLRELLACAQSDAVWTPSTWERDQVLQELPQADVAAWPLAQELRPPRKSWGERSGIGFIGGFRHAPNGDAVRFFVSEVLPLLRAEEPALTFAVAGSQLPADLAALEQPGVRMLGHVGDLQAFFEELRLTVAPLRFGAGMKGKVAASLAAGVPVAGTTLAFEGMELGPEEGVVVADDPAALARAILRVYREKDVWSRLSQAGYERAARDYSVASGVRHLAGALARLGVVTRAVEDGLGHARPRPAPFDVPGLEVDVCRTRAEYAALREGRRVRERVAFEESLIRHAENDVVTWRAYSLPARRSVAYRGAVTLDPAGRRRVGWREELLCPVTSLNNRQRATAAFAQRILEDAAQAAGDVYLTEQVTPLFRWMSERFQTVRVTGSEYLGPAARGGEVRDGITHQDIERLSLGDATQDLVLSCDVLEHVDQPQAALRELARVLRPGGHLLFTVPFLWNQEHNRRRARLAGASVEHLVEPCYHGNPMDPNGSLAFFDFGWELLDWVRAAGFADVSVACYWSAALGHLGGLLEVFHARK